MDEIKFQVHVQVLNAKYGKCLMGQDILNDFISDRPRTDYLAIEPKFTSCIQHERYIHFLIMI